MQACDQFPTKGFTRPIKRVRVIKISRNLSNYYDNTLHIYLSGIFSQFKVFTVFYKNTFLHISPFYPTTKILCFILLFKGPDSPKLAPSLVGIWTPSEIWFLLPTRIYNSNGISIGLAVLHSSPQRVPILYNGPQSPPLKIAHFHGRSGPHLTHDSLSPPESSTQTASRSLQPFLQGSLV